MKNGIFEIDDKVRCVKNVCGSWGDSYVGCEGVVEHVTRPSDFPYSVRFVDGRLGDCWPTELELIVEPARKFVVGDHVRLTALGYARWTHGDLFVGTTGVIVGFNEHLYLVDFASDDDFTWNMEHDSIEAVEESTPANDDDAAVIRGVFAKVAGLSFLNENGEVLVFDEDGDGIAAMTLAQFNEVHRILNEEGNA